MTALYATVRTLAGATIAAAGVLALAACSSPAPAPTATATVTQTVTPAPVAEEVKRVGQLTAQQAWGLCYAQTVKSEVISNVLKAPLFADSVVEARADDSWFVGFDGEVSVNALATPGRTWCLISGPVENFSDIGHASEPGKTIADLDPQADRTDPQFSGSES